MYRPLALRRAAVVSAFATASMLALLPARAQQPDPGRDRAASARIKIVALGSSSTYGAGASTSTAANPSRLAEELAKHFPGHEFTVLNRGVNGEEITDMLMRLDTAVIAGAVAGRHQLGALRHSLRAARRGIA